MSVGQDLVNKTFVVGQYSSGTTTTDATGNYVYTETDNHPYATFGTSSFKIDSVTTSGGMTTISGTIQTSLGPQQLSGTLIANDTNSFLVIATFGTGPTAQSGTIYVTNSAASQPGVNSSKTIPSEDKNIVYDANSVCFVAGTIIRTERGDIEVEHLVVGDRVITATGSCRQIRWLGHRMLDCRHHPRPENVAPVRIAAHAFGVDLPQRDLFLSPGHPVLVGAEADGSFGHLVPIMCLVNGTTIEHAQVETVTYWHVELDEHDILLAEGLPAESYLDWGDRAFFDEASDHALHNPDFVVPGLGARCRPVAVDGPVVEAERRRLDAVFNARLREASAWPDADAFTGHEAA